MFATYLYGQQPFYKIIPPQYELEHIKLRFSGNPDRLHSTKEDKEGNLWLPGTQGLHVFDGNNVITYRTDSREFPLFSGSGNNGFRCNTMEKTGLFWLSDGNNRIFKFDPYKRMVVDSLNTKPAPGEVNLALAYSATSGLYFASVNFNKGIVSLFHKTGQVAEKIFESAYTINNGCYYFLAGNEHWIIDNHQAIRLSLDGKKSSRYSYPNGPISELKMFADDEAVYFADTENQSIYTWNKTADKMVVYMKLPPMERGRMQAFYIENDKVYLGNNLYLIIIDRAAGTLQDMSSQFTELVKKEAPNSLSEQLNKFILQRDGSMLLLTYNNIYRIKKKLPPPTLFRQHVDAERNYTKPTSYRALAEDDNKNIYATYYTGISKKSAGSSTFKTIPTAHYLKRDKISTYSLNYRNNSLLWNNIRIDIKTGKFKYLFDSVSIGHCTQLLVNDSLWLYGWGTGQLHCYDLTRSVLTSYDFELIPNANLQEDGKVDINDMIEDASGANLWVSSRAFGLCLVSKKGKLLKQYRHKELYITDNYITDLYLEGEQLWFGCTDGLGLLNTKTGKTTIFKHPFISNGRLINRSVFSIQRSSDKNLFLGSSYGLLYFDTKTNTSYNLPEGHPLSTPEFNRASVLKTSDGRYYFGSTDGLYSFMPDELVFSKSTGPLKPIRIVGISIFNSKDNDYKYLSQNLNGLKKLTLGPFEKNIEISLSVTDFFRHVYYSYRIQSQGDKWTAYKPDNKISLYGLQPGSYILEIKASTSLSDDHAVYYSLPIEVKQVWYKKWWVISLFILTGAALLVGFQRYRYNQKAQRQKVLAALRTKISSDLHDDVGTILSGLAMQSQMLTYSVNEEQKKSLKEISSMSKEAMEHMRDTVWAMDSRKDKYENLVDRMRDFAEKNLPLKKITHEFIMENVEGKKFINPEKRQTIYLIFKEAITNIIKHSDGKHVIIHFIEEKSNTTLSIKDDGSEKETTYSDGLGISNMKMRAEKIGGKLTTGYDSGFLIRLIV